MGRNARALFDNGYKLENYNSMISKTLLKACRSVGIKHRFHDLRHTFAVIRYLLTGNIYSVKKDLGHASVTTTEIYADFKTSRLLADFPSLKKLIEKQQNIAKIPIMDTDSMDTRGFLSSVEQRAHNPFSILLTKTVYKTGVMCPI